MQNKRIFVNSCGPPEHSLWVLHRCMKKWIRTLNRKFAISRNLQLSLRLQRSLDTTVRRCFYTNSSNHLFFGVSQLLEQTVLSVKPSFSFSSIKAKLSRGSRVTVCPRSQWTTCTSLRHKMVLLNFVPSTCAPNTFLRKPVIAAPRDSSSRSPFRNGETPVHHAHLWKVSPMIAELAPQQNLTTMHNENEPKVTVLTDGISAHDTLQTPAYYPSFFRILYDLFRQDFRLIELGRLYGPVYQTKGVLGAYTAVANHDAIIDISRTPHLFTVVEAFPLQFTSILGSDAIPFIDGVEHKTARGRVLPTFIASTIPAYHTIIVNHAQEFFQSFAENSLLSGLVNMEKPVKLYFVDLIIKLSMNASAIDESKGPKNGQNYGTTFEMLCTTFIDFSNGLTSPTFSPTYKRGLKASAILEDELSSILIRQLQNRDTRAGLRIVRECLNSDNTTNILKEGRADLMSILLATSQLDLSESNGHISLSVGEKEEIRSLARILRSIWFAGFTTQSGSLLCVLMEIFSNPKLLESLQDEQSRIPELTAQSVAKDMPLLSSALMESMRINTAVPMMFRRVMEDVVVLQHYIPKGTLIGMDYSSANLDESIFENPETFIPDRFVGKPELARKVMVYGAAGSAHYCVGALLATTTLKTTLAVMMRDFVIDVKPWAERSLKTIPDTVPRNGVWLRSCKRKNS